MLIRKNVILLLLFALHAGAEVFKTNEIPVVPAEDLVPPPEDQESLLVRFKPNDQQAQKSFFQRVVTWFGFNGNSQSNVKNAKKQTLKQQTTKQNGYVYENPAKPLSPQPPPQKLQQAPGYQYEDPTKILQNGFRFEPSPAKLHQEPFAGYSYDPPKLQQQNQNGYNYDPPPAKLQQQPNQNGYNYDPPPVKLQQQQNQNGYNYDPPPVKLQQQPNSQPQSGYTYNPPANPLKLQEATPTGYTYSVPPVKLQEPSKQPQLGGYNYPAPANPLKLQQRPLNFNDLVSSAASPTAVYGLPPINQFSQAQTSDSFPCNKIPWLPMFPNPQEMDMLRAKLQAKNPSYLYPQLNGYQNIQPIARPQPEKFTQQLNAHTYLPPRQRPLRQPSQSQINSINSLNSLPLQGTPQPFKSPPSTISSAYLPSQNVLLPVETTQHHLVPIPVPNLSITPIPPLYDPKPFTANDAQANAFANGFYINGKLVTPTGLSTTSVQSLQYFNQNHPVTQPQKFAELTNSYGAPPIPTQTPPSVTYGTPTNTYGTPPVTYGPPTNTFGTPPIKLTAEVTESSVFGRFSASQPFTARPTLSSVDQSRLSSSNVENSNLAEKPIVISDSAADASESTRSPQDANTISDENQPILQVLQELNVTTTPQGFQYAATSTQPSIAMSSANQIKRKEIKGNSNRETPIDLLDTRVSGDRVPDFKFMRNTWKPLPPNPFSSPAGPSVVTTATPYYSSPITPSSASAAFQSHTPHDANSIGNGGHEHNDGTKRKKLQIIIPYTSKSRPSPFKNNNHAELQSFESSAGWSNSQHHDDHNSEESQVVSAATPSPKTTTSKRKHPHYTNVIAKNIRELLKREHLKNISNLSSVDLEKLQKNIDGWTEQEFSMSPNRASTISLVAQPKHIPFEYLTTTPSIQDILTTETMQPTTDYPTTMLEIGESTEGDDSQDEGEGEVMDDEGEDENEIRDAENNNENIGTDEQEAIQAAEEIENEDFKRINYLKALENNHVSGSEHHNIFYATNPPPQPKTTTPVPPCSTSTQSPDDNETIIRTTVLPSADELWNKLKSLLSSSSERGKEKVYIVTPQPYPYFESEKIISDDENEVGSFKSPRFLVRPTPGASNGRSFSSVARLTLKPKAANRLQTTTVKTTWHDASTEPTNPATEIFRSSTHSHSVVNGHAHAQAFSYVTPRTFIDHAQNVQVEDEGDDDDDDDDNNNNREDDDLIQTDTHRRSLHEYKH